MISTVERTSFAYKNSFDERKYEINSESNESNESPRETTVHTFVDGCKFSYLWKNSFDSEKQLVDHCSIHGIPSAWNHPISEDPENCKNSTLFENKMNTGISVATVVVRPHKCHLCGLVFDRISQLDNHSRSVHGHERSQVCQICGKGFFRQTDLKTHLNIHLGTNRCVCEVCGRKFNHVSNLIRHSRTHSGVKPYPCTICGKRFTQINTLARHKVIHKRRDEIMECCFCDKRYKSESGLKEHMRKLHGFSERPGSEDNGRIIKRRHYCTICGESFQFVDLLRAHEKTHRNFETLECKSCDQKFQNTDEIKEHRCGRPRLLVTNGTRARKISENKSGTNSPEENECVLTQLGGINEDSKDPSSSNGAHTRTENSIINERKNSVRDELNEKLCRDKITSSDEPAEDKGTKETIAYATTEQLANMNTEQVVDTANHFLHQHLMELAAEGSLQAENIASRDCDGETVVSEMINSCWKEIEMPDVNELELVEKRDSLPPKNIAQSIIYIHALEKDGLILLNGNGNSAGNLAPDLTPEKCIDAKRELTLFENSSICTDPENGQAIKVCANEYPEEGTSDLLQNETRSKKLSCNSVLHLNVNRNPREQSERQERSGKSTARVTRGARTQNTGDYFGEENFKENDQLLVETHNTFEELVKRNDDNVENLVVGKSSENPEPTLRLVQTENGEEFYELLITNSSEKSENALELDKISGLTIDENLTAARNEPLPESLLKLIQLENGQRALELTRSTSSDETNRRKEVEDVVQASAASVFAGTSASQKVEHGESRAKNCAPNKCEKIFYLAQNNRDSSIDFFEIETLGSQEQNSFNLASDETMENVSQTSFDHLQTMNRNKGLGDKPQIDNETCEELFGLIQSDVTKQNEKSKIESKKARKEDGGPMVRLVQNEDGAQFFELIRRDLDLDETQDFESDERPNGSIQLSNDAGGAAANLGVESGSTINDIAKLESDTSRKKKQKNDAKKYNCDVCKKSFSKGYNYRQHIGTHFADQQKFKCKECGTCFAWKSTLNKHMATHRAGGQQKFVCEICPKVYTTLSQVNEHVKRDHLKERNHKCVHCAKTFFKKFDLKIHIRTHTKERPYECRVCYKSFHYQSHIIRHERIHSGERPYACNICEKTFTQLGSLKNHRQRHQELKIDILDYQMDEDDPLPQTTL